MMKKVLVLAEAAFAACGAGAITATKDYVDRKIEPLCTIRAFEDFCRTNSVLIGGPYLPAESEISSNTFSGAWMSGPVWPYRRWFYRPMEEDLPWRPVLFDFSAGAMVTKGMLLNDGWDGLAALIQADYPDMTITTQALPRYVEARAVEPVTQLVWSAWHVVPSKWRILQDDGSALTLRADSIETEAEQQINGITWVHYNSTTVTGLASNISGVYAWRSRVHKHGHALESDRIADRAEFEAGISANAAAIETNAMRIAENAAAVSALGANAVTQSDVMVVSNIAASADAKASTLVSYVQGDDVMDVVTNYDSAVHIASRSLRQRVEDGGTNVWRVVWDEMSRWNWFLYDYMPTNHYNKADVDSALDEKADRAWGFYDSHTGGWSPDGYTQISSPKILIAAGMAYQRHVTTAGGVWVLESNGLVTEVGGVSSNGFFRISDDEGNALFEIVKGNKRTIGATAGAITTEEIMGVTHMHISYAVESEEHPTIEATTDLGTAFVGEDSASSLVNVAWSGSSGDWHAEVWPKVASPSLFVRASYEVGGETYIKNTAPTGLDGGLVYNGIRYRVVPYTMGGKTYLTLEAWQ